ncbi:MAG: TIGR03435 family protein [Candidatus Sumerlaeaceae bacterium]
MTIALTGETATSMSDRELVRLTLEGDSQAFEVLVTRHYSAVYCIALAHLTNREAAEDCCQEVFLRAYLNLWRVGDPDRIAGWLCRVCRNLALDWLRNNSRRVLEFPHVRAESEILNNTADVHQPSQREQLDNKTKLYQLHEALHQLPAAQRELLVLHYVQELNDREIGELLNVHRTTVRYHLGRALDQCRKLVDSAALRDALSAITPRPAHALRTLATAALLADASRKSHALSSSLAPAELPWVAPGMGSGLGFKTLWNGVLVALGKKATLGIATVIAAAIGVGTLEVTQGGVFRPNKVEFSAPTGPSGSSEIEGLRGITGICRIRNAFDLGNAVQMLYFDAQSRFTGLERLPNEQRHDILIQSHPLCGTGGIRNLFRRELEKRYGCTITREQLTTNVYLLRTVGGKPAPGLHRLKSVWGGPTSVGGYRAGLQTISRDTMNGFAHMIESQLAIPVINETGLKGDYAGMVRWKPGDHDAFIAALREYLGLKLVPAQRKLDYIVIRKLTASGDMRGTASIVAVPQKANR